MMSKKTALTTAVAFSYPSATGPGKNISVLISDKAPQDKVFRELMMIGPGEKLVPGFLVVGAYDAMEAIFHVIREQKGKVDPDRTMELLKQYKNPNSPRGPIALDPETRDVVQNIYLREVRKVGGQLANVEIETLATAAKDPWKVFNKKK